MHAEAFKNASSLSRRRMTSASNVAPELKMVESYKKRICRARARVGCEGSTTRYKVQGCRRKKMRLGS
eukprot:1161824-Pelagomonas_calceolata.AAC.7